MTNNKDNDIIKSSKEAIKNTNTKRKERRKIMRKLMYDCYCKGVKIKSVATIQEAKEWKKEKSFNTVKEVMVDYQQERQETEEERKERLEKIAKRQKAIRTKEKR